MAATSYSPMPASIPDPVTLEEAVELFRETGHPISKSTLERLIRQKGFATERVGKTGYVSYTDLLEAHAEWVRRKR